MKYPNGYYPKIEYWTLKLNQAVASKATAEVEYCLKKLSYFTSAQYVKENESEYTNQYCRYYYTSNKLR